MKKFLIIISSIIFLFLLFDFTYYHLGWYIDFSPSQPVTTFVHTQGDKIYLDSKDGFKEFEIRGVDLGSGIPGEWAFDFGASKEDYLRWFGLIQEMGANTIRIYTIHDDIFYDAFYEYNQNNEEPLYLLHGVWVNDYLYNSRKDAFDEELLDIFIRDCKIMVDIIHGNRKITLGSVSSAGYGSYRKDISPWVIGYILGTEWEDLTVVYTNEKYKDKDAYASYNGKYLYSKEHATPFEVMLAQVGDSVIAYESIRYKTQKLLAFSNWPVTDPFIYPDYISEYFLKCATLDVENIGSTENFLSGQFASYHVYPYQRDYLSYVTDFSDLDFPVDIQSCTEGDQLNTYKLYLSTLTDHHQMPVVITEFGVPTGRGIAGEDTNTGRNEGRISESEQGEALVDCYHDIMEAGCSGCCIFSWQDEWFKRSWNTNYAVDFSRTPYWSDYQTSDQYFGLLAFDPGQESSVCYVDGDILEWTQEDLVVENDNISLSMKYDEAFVYFMIQKENMDFSQETFYIPIDTNPKIGSSYCANYQLKFDRAVDFLIRISGTKDSRILVQERYEALRANYAPYIYQFDTYLKKNIPQRNSPKFVDIYQIVQMTQLDTPNTKLQARLFPTGILSYGNANPDSRNYDSLADYCHQDDHVEIRIPWQLLNFSDPSRMSIHDDYYDENYGVTFISIDRMYVGILDHSNKERTSLKDFPLKGWGNQVTYHERLKDSYHVIKNLWTTPES